MFWMSQWMPVIKRSEREQRPMPSMCVTCPIDQLIAEISDWRGLKTSAAWLLRLKAMLLGGICLFRLVELLKTEVAIICFCRQQRFSEEISTLSSKKAAVSRVSPIYRLDPVLKGAKQPFHRLQRPACFYGHSQTSSSESGPWWANSLSTVRRIFWIKNACSCC